MKMAFRIIPAILALALITSCSNSSLTKSGNSSSATGWEYNKEENGGFEVKSVPDQVTGPGLSFVEGGTFTMGKFQDDVLYEWNNVPRRVTVSSFYMDETEITNVNYREYIYWLDRVFGANNHDVLVDALPDTLVWRDIMAYNEPMVEYYFRYPAYNEYPVVGVNWTQANNYSLWRTDRVNEKLLVDEGVLEQIDTDQQDENNFNTEAFLYNLYSPADGQGGQVESLRPGQDLRRIRREDGFMLPKYRLPTEAEWEYAALGLIGNSVDELVWERKTYPWNGHIVRNDNPRHMGEMRANFVRGNGDYMGTAGDLNDHGGFTVPVREYWPNDYGLYCMAGNVNEWVLDVYRPMSYTDVSEFNPYRGNVFMKKRLDANNYPMKDSLGRIMYDTVQADDARGRFNYRYGDYRNYHDGDQASVLKEGNVADKTLYDGSSSMYVNEDNAEIGPDRYSLIADNVRVYKGGSWKDRAYWLSPGERRFLRETESRDDLGFRCAMIRVGTPSK